MLFFTGAQLTGQLAVTLVQTIPVPIGIGVKACIPTTKGSIFVIYWIFPLAAHLFLTLFIFIKSWQLSASSSGFTTFARIQAVIFTRNGLVFPICVVLVEIAQIIFSLVVEDMQRAVRTHLACLSHTC